MRQAIRLLGAVVLVMIGVFLVVRAVVAIVTVDPGDTASYRDDWGGPSYFGVLLVHAGPGLLVLVVAGVTLVRRRRNRGH